MNLRLAPIAATAATILALPGCGRDAPVAVQAEGMCPADGPVEMARWIYSTDRYFVSTSTKEPKVGPNAISAQLYSLLERNWKCENDEQGQCAVGADPWTNAQDGDALPPIQFEMANSAASTATVRMRYLFGWPAGTPAPKPVAAETKLNFIKDDKSGCWLLDDLVGREGRSLRATLQAYPYGA